VGGAGPTGPAERPWLAGRSWRSTARLADGREIIYFDESPGLNRAAVADQRDLSAHDARSALRWDRLAGEWVMYAAERQDRLFRPAAGSCPLCPSRPGRYTEIPAPGYDVAVFENRFPALAGPDGGRCEVVCFTADHDGSFAALDPRRVRTVFDAWADRTAELGSLPGVRHVYCFENRGEEIGVTLHHPHGQVYAFPFLPPRVSLLSARAAAHLAETGRNLFDDVVAAEVADGRRIVARNDHWIAFVPEAARWPFEVMIFPSSRVPDLPAVPDPARDAFAPVYQDALLRLDALFGAPMPYIAAWQQAPSGDQAEIGPAGADEDAAAGRTEFGLHLHLMAIRRAEGKLKYAAGTESGAGAWSNDVLPEEAARLLRAARAPASDKHSAAGDAWSGDNASWFRRCYGRAPEVAWRAPGRVNLIGEHTDYNGGLVLPFAIDRSVEVTGTSRTDGILEVRSRQVPDDWVRIRLDELEPATVAGWAAYPAGVAWALGDRRGASLLIDSDLPQGAGLASSAALECAVAGCLADLAGSNKSRHEIAELAWRAENEFVGMPCGIMDQSAVMLCRSGHALLLDCRSLRSDDVPLDPAGLRLLIIDTGVRHELTSGQYAARRRECERAATQLGVRLLREVTNPADVMALDDPVLVRRARHVVTENVRVRQVAGLLREGRLGECGPLLNQSHRSLRDDFEVSWPAANVAVEAAIAAGALGARMTGGGFGGNVLALLAAADADAVVAAVQAASAVAGWPAPAVLDAVPAAGAARLVR
jgi:UDPglucose--hexose-1-phosphate uridylyltransferase